MKNYLPPKIQSKIKYRAEFEIKKMSYQLGKLRDY